MPTHHWTSMSLPLARNLVRKLSTYSGTSNSNERPFLLSPVFNFSIIWAKTHAVPPCLLKVCYPDSVTYPMKGFSNNLGASRASRASWSFLGLPGASRASWHRARSFVPPKTPYSRSKQLVRSKWLLEHAPERSERSNGCSGMLLIPRSLKMAARTCFCPPLTSKMVAREYAQTRLCGQNGCSSMLQSAQDAHMAAWACF